MGCHTFGTKIAYIIKTLTFIIMNKGRKITIGAKFRTAGSTGKKGHVIAREGHWVVFREGADRILYEFDDKKKAVLSGKKY
tara:strand:- start:2181 stop:2423 length:243 start_codon:yes stop_codon:yes gene_type:complete